MSQQPSDATFDDGTSRLQLRGNISAGLLDVECQDFITGNDTFTVVRELSQDNLSIAHFSLMKAVVSLCCS